MTRAGPDSPFMPGPQNFYLVTTKTRPDNGERQAEGFGFCRPITELYRAPRLFMLYYGVLPQGAAEYALDVPTSYAS